MKHANPEYMRMFLETNVYDEALSRLAWIFDEFPNVIVDVSGGKDSTVLFNLSMQVAREKGRLPLKVMFFDQEAEWAATIDEIKKMMYHTDVEPWWFQFPMRLFNATSSSDHWLKCWDPERQEDWVHQQDPISIKENLIGTDRFAKLFLAAGNHYWPGVKTAQLAGVRTEESRVRFMGLVGEPVYKWVTWGNKAGAADGQYTFYPIYDWSYSDVWKAIYSNGWHYNRIYDQMYRYGIPIQNMRVSNVHHETAVGSLFYMQELEPDTFERLVHRIEGIHMAAQMGEDYFVDELPFMFESWREYRDYLLEKLIDNPEWRRRLQGIFALHDRTLGEDMGKVKYLAHIQSILTNDWEGAKLIHFTTSGPVDRVRKKRRKTQLRMVPMETLEDSLIDAAKEEGLIFNTSTDLYRVFVGDTIVGLNGFMWSKTKAVMKNQFILPEHRRKGHFAEVMDQSILLARGRGVTKLEASCTPMSVGEWLKRGATTLETFKNGVTRVELDITGEGA